MLKACKQAEVVKTIPYCIMSENTNNHRNLLNTMLSVIDPFQVFRHHETDHNKHNGKPRKLKFTTSRSLEALLFLVLFFGFFGFLA